MATIARHWPKSIGWRSCGRQPHPFGRRCRIFHLSSGGIIWSVFSWLWMISTAKNCLIEGIMRKVAGIVHSQPSTVLKYVPAGQPFPTPLPRAHCRFSCRQLYPLQYRPWPQSLRRQSASLLRIRLSVLLEGQCCFGHRFLPLDAHVPGPRNAHMSIDPPNTSSLMQT